MGPTVAEIYHRNLVHNISLIQKNAVKAKVMAVVKANAYGHGSVEIAKSAISAGCEYLGVAFAEEGIELRNEGITAPVLVFGAHRAEDLQKAAQKNLEITITSKKQLTETENIAKTHNLYFAVHIKVDTGMGRVGFRSEYFEDALKKVLSSKYMRLKGIYSHLSSSDEHDPTFTLNQINNFENIKSIADKYIQHKILYHLANSAAIMKYSQSYFDMVRPGIMLYGCLPNPEFPLSWDLKQVMKFKTKIGLIKNMKKNEPVSYGRRYYTLNNTKIAVLPVGYADGYSRMNTNNAVVQIKNKSFPVVGTVCMDMIMIDLGQDNNVETGSDVILYDTNREHDNSIDNIAKILGTIGYEVTCNVSKRVRRIHIYDQE